MVLGWDLTYDMTSFLEGSVKKCDGKELMPDRLSISRTIPELASSIIMDWNGESDCGFDENNLIWRDYDIFTNIDEFDNIHEIG